MGSRDTPPEKRLKSISFRKRENKGERAQRKSAKMTNSKQVDDGTGYTVRNPCVTPGGQELLLVRRIRISPVAYCAKIWV